MSQLETVDMLQPLLQQLDPRERRIFELRFVEGWIQSDIGVSQMQISRLLRRIIDELRTKLQSAHVAA